MTRPNEDKQLANAMKSLQQDDRWNAVLTLLDRRIQKIRAESPAGTSAYDELKDIHIRQGKVAGLLEFFNDLERSAFDTEN